MLLLQQKKKRGSYTSTISLTISEKCCDELNYDNKLRTRTRIEIKAPISSSKCIHQLP